MRLTISSLSEAIRRRRRELGLTQTDLARQVGMTRQWIAKVETDARDAPLGKVVALADLLDLELELSEPEASTSPYADLENTARLNTLLGDLRKSASEVPTIQRVE